MGIVVPSAAFLRIKAVRGLAIFVIISHPWTVEGAIGASTLTSTTVPANQTCRLPLQAVLLIVYAIFSNRIAKQVPGVSRNHYRLHENTNETQAARKTQR